MKSIEKVVIKMKTPITLKKLQKFVKKRDNKQAKKMDYFMKFIEEVGELSEMIKKEKKLDYEDDRTKAIKNTMDEEIADVLYYLVVLANVNKVDLEEAFLRKMEYNVKNGK
jgi:NTP pyrophosphatase (non-canonical NTP hydrolase)